MSNKHIFDMTRPVTDIKSLLEYAKAIVDGKNPNPNIGLMSADEYNNQPKGVTIPPLYQPVRVQQMLKTRSPMALSGQAKKHPSKPNNWPNFLGEWRPGLYIADPGDPTQTSKPRRCHAEDARDLVVDREKNVLKIGNCEYIVGNDESAIFLINGSDPNRGNYGANIRAAKLLSFHGMNEITNLVGRFNRSMFVEHLDDGTKPGGQVVWHANHVINNWGYLTRNGKQMNYAQIRAAVESGKLDGIEFAACDVIVGKSFTKEQCWQQVQLLMNSDSTKNSDNQTALARFESRKSDDKNSDQKAWHNFGVQCRTNPNEVFPLGFFNSQTMIVPVIHFGDNLDEEFGRMIIGRRVGAEFSENQWQARSRLGMSKPKVKVERAIVAKVEEPKVKAKTEKVKVKTKPKAEKSKPSEYNVGERNTGKAEKKVKSAKKKPSKVKNKKTESIPSPLDSTIVDDYEINPADVIDGDPNLKISGEYNVDERNTGVDDDDEIFDEIEDVA